MSEHLKSEHVFVGIRVLHLAVAPEFAVVEMGEFQGDLFDDSVALAAQRYRR